MNSSIPSQNRATSKVFLFAGLMLIASVLRTPITNVGPLLDVIQADLLISPTMAGVLTSLPVFIFAALSPLAGVARKVGIEKSLMSALLLIAGGTLVRSFGWPSTLFAGTILLSLGIAVANVLLPTVIKRDFPARAALLTTSYVTWMSSLGAVSSGIAVPAAAWAAFYLYGEGAPLSWQVSLGMWAVLAIIAIFVWLPQLKCRVKIPDSTTAEAKSRSVLKSPIAWQVTTFMGFQAMGFYVMIAWLSAILQDGGHTAEKSGWLVAFYQMVGLGSGLLLPFIVSRTKDQRVLTALCGSFCALGALGLFLAPKLAVLWLGLSGFGGGGSFILAISFISLRTSTHRQAISMSALVNGGGYFIAATGPLFFGILHDITSGWHYVLIGLTITGTIQTVLGWLAGRDKTVDD